MSGRPTYLPTALKRIERLGESAIIAFFGEIHHEQLKTAMAILPPLAGFRPGSDAAIQRQIRFLAQKVAAHRTRKRFTYSPEENALYELWRAWSQSQINDSDIVRKLFDNLDEESESSDKSEHLAAAIKELASGGECARETLKRLVFFSPFENVDDFLVIVESARTEAEIARDSTLIELPERLHANDARLQILETKLDASDRKVALLKSELEKIRRAVSSLGAKATEDRAVIGELNQATDSLIQSSHATDEALSGLKHAIDRLAERITADERRTGVVAESQGSLQYEIASALTNMDRLSDQISVYDGRVAQITSEIRFCAAELTSVGERLSQLDRLVARIDQLESMLLETAAIKPAKGGATDPNQEEQTPAGARFSSPEAVVIVEKLRLESGLSVKSLHSVAEILSSLDAALVEAGLKKSMASSFAEEILSAAASEQVIFFRGGFAVDVARKCALSLSGTAVFRVGIPLGLSDPSVLRRRLSNRPGFTPGDVASIIIEGVNNSPLDILRDVLLDQVTYRIGGLGCQDPTLIFASLVDGAGAFPVEPSFLELGPVFDLERMDWRRLRREKLPVLGSLSRADWQSIAAAWDGAAMDYEEALQGARQLAPRRNTRVEANVIRAFCTLKTIRREQGLTPLQSVTFGWLSPYWQSLGVKTDDIEAQIDGGKCDGTVVDDRLKAFLAEYRCHGAGDPT